MMRNFRPFLLVTLDIATYNCPWLKTGFGRYTPTCFKDWPWLLLIVIAKHTEIGNYRLFKRNGHFDSLGDNVILGIKTCAPILVLVMIFASMTHVPSLVITNLVPLQTPAFWFRFQSNMIGKADFNFNLWFGNPGNPNVFKNSPRYKTSWSAIFEEALHLESELKYVCSSM